MANTFSSSLMPRILAGALEVLREEVAFVKNMAKDFDGASGHIGQVVSVNVPYAQDIYNITPAAVPPALVESQLNARLITINNWKGSRFSFTPKEVMEYDFANSQFVPKQVAEAVRVIARSINQSITALWPKIPNITGNVSSRMFASNIDGLSEVDQRLNFQLCPAANRFYMMGLEDRADAIKLDDVKKNPQMAGDHDVFRKAFLGRVFDFDLVHDRDVAISGAAGTGITGTATCGITAKGSTTISVTMSAGGSDSIHLHDGDVFMISDDSTASSQVMRRQYASVGAVTIGNGATGTITIDHPLETALAGSETLTIATGQGAGRVNIAGDLSGFGLVMRVPPQSVQGAPVIGDELAMTDPVSGIPLKLVYIPGYHAAQFEVSALWGTDVVDWRRLTRNYSKT